MLEAIWMLVTGLICTSLAMWIIEGLMFIWDRYDDYEWSRRKHRWMVFVMMAAYVNSVFFALYAAYRLICLLCGLE